MASFIRREEEGVNSSRRTLSEGENILFRAVREELFLYLFSLSFFSNIQWEEERASGSLIKIETER